MQRYAYEASRLEVFNGVILNHLDENPNLIYAILRSHKSFEDMGTFTLTRGLREIRRIQLAKEEQAKRQTGNGKGKNSEEDRSAPEHEKARLLSSESRDTLGLQTEPDLEARLPRDVPRPPVRTGSTPDQRSGSPEEPTVPQPLMSPTTTESPMGAQSKSEMAN